MTQPLPPSLVRRMEDAWEEKFITASGPGGQNVNKVATAVQLRVSIYAMRLPPQVFKRLKDLAGNRLTSEGELLITSREHRTQDMNRAEAREKLFDLVQKAHLAPPKRAKTRLNRVGKTKRLAGKKARGDVKKMRGKVRMD